MKALLIGYGEIGKGVSEACRARHSLKISDPDKGMVVDLNSLKKIEILLIAIPWSEDHFVTTVKYWQEKMPDYVSTIVFSTVPIGTCKTVDAVHFPVEAKHPHIYRDLLLNKNCYMGGRDFLARKFLNQMGLKFTVLDEPEFTEFLKLRSTTLYGINIEFARYTKDVCDRLGLDFQVIKDYDTTHNELNFRRRTLEYTRYILDAPEGVIGGHCVVPNAVILQKQFPNNLVQEIVANNVNENEFTYTARHTIPIMKRGHRFVKIGVDTGTGEQV